MKKIICIDSKAYKLTEGNEYEVYNETGSRYEIINDGNIQVNYSKSLFEEVPEEVEELEEAKDTVEQVISTLEINYNFRRATITVDGQSISFCNPLYVTDSIISCGIQQLSELNNLGDILIEALEEEGLTSERISEIFNPVYKAILNHLLESELEGSCLILASTNIDNNDYFEVIDEILHNYSFSEVTEHNINSGNDIKLWVLGNIE